MKPDAIRTSKAKFSEVVLVCAKCAKRQGLAKGELRARLKREVKRRDRGRVRVIETGCLGPCPKRLVAVATTRSVAAGRLLLVDPALTPREALDAILPEVSLPDPGIPDSCLPDSCLPDSCLPDFGPKATLALNPVATRRAEASLPARSPPGGEGPA